MDMNSISAEKYEVATAYEGYEANADLVAKIKEGAAGEKNKTGQPSKEFLEQQAAIFERSEVKSFLSKFDYESLNELGSRRLDEQLKKDGYIVGWRTYSSEFEGMSSKERLEVYRDAYAKMYDEIERGYADGTRHKNVLDLRMPGDDMYDKIRPLTKEEELTALKKAYEYKVTCLTGKMKQELDNELVRQGKIKLTKPDFPKRNQNAIAAYTSQTAQQPKKEAPEEIKEFAKNVTFDTPGELEDKKMAFINQISQNMLNISSLLEQQYSQTKPGTFDITEFLKNISQLK